MNTGNAPIAPTSRSNRLFIIDFLRGAAILGLILANMSFYNTPFHAQTGEFTLWDDTANRIANLFIWFFVEGKFYPLFSLLFGMGFYLFLQKANDSMDEVVLTFRKRLFFLLLFGLLHVLLLWYADILIVYALFGLILTWFRNRSDRTILRSAIIFIMIPVVVVGLSIGFLKLAMMVPEAAESIEANFAYQMTQTEELIDETITTYSTGSFAEIVSMRLAEYANTLPGYLFFYPNFLAMLFVGFYIGRKKIFENPASGLSVWKRVFWWCLPLALVFNLVVAYYNQTASYIFPDWDLLLITIGYGIGGPSMMFVYIYILGVIYHKNLLKKITYAICRTGQMAFTNYLTHSIICTTLFYSYGFGLYGKVNYWQGIIIALAIYIIQVIWSHYWLTYFRFGPFEWLWRSLTYGKRQPMKRGNSHNHIKT